MGFNQFINNQSEPTLWIINGCTRNGFGNKSKTNNQKVSQGDRTRMSNIIRFPKIEDKKPLGLMTSFQVIDLFQISKSTLYRWSNVDNILPKLKVGRRVYFKREDIDNLLRYR